MHLHRVGDRLEGRFTARWPVFMTMRSAVRPELVARSGRVSGGRSRSTDVPAAPWNEATVAWFLAQLRPPPGTLFGYDLDDDTRLPVATSFAAPDGSWAQVSLTDATVTEAGDTPLAGHRMGLRTVERYRRPSWDQLGLTVNPNGAHRVWFDDPSGSHRWLLEGPRAR